MCQYGLAGGVGPTKKVKQFILNSNTSLKAGAHDQNTSLKVGAHDQRQPNVTLSFVFV